LLARRFEGVSVNDPGTASNEDGPGRVEGKGKGELLKPICAFVDIANFE